MKIAFVQPGWGQAFGPGLSRLASAFASPPIGLGILAAIARDAGHAVSYLDGYASGGTVDDVVAGIVAEAPDVVALSGMTPTHADACELARRVRARLPRAVVVLGGVHVSLLGAEALIPEIHFGFRGEAEEQLLRVLDAAAGRCDPASVPGLVWRAPDGRLVDNGLAPLVQALDSVPYPAWDLYPLQAYRVNVAGRRDVPYVNLMMTRGCPFPCVFCSAGELQGRRIRVRSPEHVVGEMQQLAERFGIRHFLFQDSNLTLDRALVLQLCDLIEVRGLRVTWEGWTRADLVDRELLTRMKRAGFVRLQIGVESGSAEILQRIRKQVSLPQIREAFRLAGEVGLEATCAAMMGLPGETEAHVWETARFIRSIPEIGYSPLSIAIPYPGTELRRMAEAGEHGLKLLPGDWSTYRRYDGGVMEVGGMGPDRLRKLQRVALLRMHLTPRKLLGLLRRFGVGRLAATALSLARDVARRAPRPAEKP